MATSRLLYGKFGAKIDLNKAMMASALLCVVSYLLIGLTNSPVLGLVGVGLCGLAVGIFWPGTFSTAAASLRGGGTAMFALMALAGDLGCSGGPTLAGAIAGAFGDNLRLGFLCAVALPGADDPGHPAHPPHRRKGLISFAIQNAMPKIQHGISIFLFLLFQECVDLRAVGHSRRGADALHGERRCRVGKARRLPQGFSLG